MTLFAPRPVVRAVVHAMVGEPGIALLRGLRLYDFAVAPVNACSAPTASIPLLARVLRRELMAVLTVCLGSMLVAKKRVVTGVAQDTIGMETVLRLGYPFKVLRSIIGLHSVFVVHLVDLITRSIADERDSYQPGNKPLSPPVRGAEYDALVAILLHPWLTNTAYPGSRAHSIPSNASQTRCAVKAFIAWDWLPLLTLHNVYCTTLEASL